MQLSVDGFVAGPNGEMDWMTWNWGEDIMKYVADLHLSVDLMLMGRKMMPGFHDAWVGRLNTPEEPFARLMIDTPKVLFSRTLTTGDFPNSRLVTGRLVEEVNAEKQRPGKDIITYGGAGFTSSLIKENLIDEYHLFINPTAIGHGLPIFRELTSKLSLKLVKAQTFECGIVVLVYTPA